MKKMKLFVIAVLGTLTLAACSTDDPLSDETSDNSYQKIDETQDVVTDRSAYSRQGKWDD